MFKEKACHIHQLTYNIECPQKTRELNLSSSSNIKIHTISQLDKFTRLRSLILANNMIAVMQGLDQLVSLRVLNLEFNLIRVLEGTANLSHLEELYLGYNQVQTITQSILHNHQLRVLQLAYNDIRQVDQISILFSQSQEVSTLPNLTALSLLGNPIISNLNYISFFKMLIPTLRYMDDKPVNDDQSTSVYPHEEVIILREAINKLLEERNQAIDRLGEYVDDTHTPRKVQESHRAIKRQSKTTDQQLKAAAEMRRFLEQEKQRYKNCAHEQRQKIQRLSKEYTAILNKQKMERIESGEEYKQDSIFEKEDDWRWNSADKGESLLTQSPKKQTKQLIRVLKKQDSKLQDYHNKIKNINRLTSTIESRQASQSDFDICKFVLETVVFGFEDKKSLSTAHYQKLSKKYLIKPCISQEPGQSGSMWGLIEYSEILKQIVFGENERSHKVDYTDIWKLKEKIRGKGLIEIIAELKEAGLEDQRKQKKYEKERQEFVERFEKESQELSRAWSQVESEKEQLIKIKRKNEKELTQKYEEKEAEMRKKYRIAEEEERVRITELKRNRENQELELEKITCEYNEIQEKLNRRFLELEQFQTHFNEFIQQKQYIKSLQVEINEITANLQKEQSSHDQLVDRIKELSLEEGILHSKVIKYDDMIKYKSRELAQIEKSRNEKQKEWEKYKAQLDIEAEQLRNVTQNVAVKIQQMKDLEKLVQRTKRVYNLQQQKINNLDQLQKSKKNNLKQLQQSIQNLKQDRELLFGQTNEIQRNIESKREELTKIQLKIQENRLAMESLSDINKNIGDMMIRQSELKRSIIELEIQNRGLLDIRNGIADQFRVKSYL